ncbi:MAG: thiamine pyrophosphokinase [Candidatus Ordinivivax streblomastigis]|uniref:Thiamine diphosphokinase n=1 Tax=Candidatus Ordinivivax streblomastigis TaxID=2540710 RepID=A0A5M8NVS7_9BACT|nr:MAG: thiamine pyrophosphokinase [Candidatus Ordinivivax streblomastigis]
MKHYPLLSLNDCPETVISANGSYPTHALPIVLLKKANYVVCCDGAADEYIRRGSVPNAIVGDGDSLSEETKKHFADRIYKDENQETNDQTKAVEFCITQGRKNIVILGATGKREDHTLGNISLLWEYMEKVNIQMVTNYGIFTPVYGDATWECLPNEQISVFNFNCTRMEGEGLEYPLRPFTNWWQGTLNKALGDRFIIHANGKYLVFRGQL